MLLIILLKNGLIEDKQVKITISERVSLAVCLFSQNRPVVGDHA